MIRKFWERVTWWRYEWVDVPIPLEDRIMAFYVAEGRRIYGDSTGWRSRR